MTWFVFVLCVILALLLLLGVARVIGKDVKDGPMAAIVVCFVVVLMAIAVVLTLPLPGLTV